jgi:hypothetical protein
MLSRGEREKERVPVLGVMIGVDRWSSLMKIVCSDDAFLHNAREEVYV